MQFDVGRDVSEMLLNHNISTQIHTTHVGCRSFDPNCPPVCCFFNKQNLPFSFGCSSWLIINLITIIIQFELFGQASTVSALFVHSVGTDSTILKMLHRNCLFSKFNTKLHYRRSTFHRISNIICQNSNKQNKCHDWLLCWNCLPTAMHRFACDRTEEA